MATINDLVLIYFEGAPMSFARIEDISPDVKKDWYLVRLLLLQIPLQTVTWILREIYINGEPFTMDGKQIRLEKVEAPPDPVPENGGDTDGPSSPPDTANGKVISFKNLKKK